MSGVRILALLPDNNKPAPVIGAGFLLLCHVAYLNHTALTVMDTKTHEVMVVINEPICAFFWAPDGKQLVFVGQVPRSDDSVSARDEVFVIDVESGEPSVVIADGKAAFGSWN